MNISLFNCDFSFLKWILLWPYSRTSMYLLFTILAAFSSGTSHFITDMLWSEIVTWQSYMTPEQTRHHRTYRVTRHQNKANSTLIICRIFRELTLHYTNIDIHWYNICHIVHLYLSGFYRPAVSMLWKPERGLNYHFHLQDDLYRATTFGND